jgi:hypothetical protein
LSELTGIPCEGRRKGTIALLVICVAIASAVFSAQSAGARNGAKEIALRSGDYFSVYDQSGFVGIVCWVDPSFRVRGTIECYRATTTGLITNSYSGAVGTDGTSVWYYPRSGRGRKVFSHPAGAQAHIPTKSGRGHWYILHEGQFAHVQGTPITCDTKTAQDPGVVECYVYDPHSRSGVKAGTLSASVGPFGVFVFRYDAAGQAHRIFLRLDPSCDAGGKPGC